MQFGVFLVVGVGCRYRGGFNSSCLTHLFSALYILHFFLFCFVFFFSPSSSQLFSISVKLKVEERETL